MVIAMLLCGEDTKKALVSEYIDKFIATKNPIRTLLMIKIGKVRFYST